MLRRVFSKDLRSEFQAVNGTRYSSWAPERLRGAIRAMFVPKVGAEMYQQYEWLFVRLIMSTWSASDIQRKYNVSVDLEFDRTIKSVLGSRPNQHSLWCFFKHEAIQRVWNLSGPRTWVLMEVRSLSIADRQKLYKYFEKIPTHEFPVLP